MNIFILEVLAQHEFDAVVHQSAHLSRDAAFAYAELTALPECRAGSEPEWHSSYVAMVREIPVIAPN